MTDETVPPPPPSGWRRLGRGQRRFVLAVVLAGFVAAASVVGASAVRSPAQVAAERRPPTATITSSLVERRALETTVLARGTARAATVVEGPVPSGVVGGPGPIITLRPVAVGSEVTPGKLVVEVSGRPVIVVVGPGSLYRDIRPGDVGRDVEAVQGALAALGYPGGDGPGRYGARTQAAVEKLYRSLGYPVVRTDPAGDEALRAAETAAADAQRRLEDLLAGRGDPAADPSAVQARIDRAAQDRDQARQRVAEQRARVGVTVPYGEILLVPELPARLSMVGADVGRKVTGPVVAVASGALRIEARVRPSDVGQVKMGARARIRHDGDQVAVGSVTAIGEVAAAPAAEPAAGQAPGGGGRGTAAESRFAPVVITTDAPVDPVVLGRDLAVTLVTATTADPVLAVPQTAIVTRSDGTTYVARLDGPGPPTDVKVSVGASAGGMLEVAPVEGGLAEGDRVVTSMENRG